MTGPLLGAAPGTLPAVCRYFTLVSAEEKDTKHSGTYRGHVLGINKLYDVLHGQMHTVSNDTVRVAGGCNVHFDGHINEITIPDDQRAAPDILTAIDFPTHSKFICDHPLIGNLAAEILWIVFHSKDVQRFFSMRWNLKPG